LQCLVVGARPLRIEELAEVLAVEFDNANRIPKFKPDWRWEYEEQALLTSCSSLISIVDGLFASCAVLAFLGQGIPDFASPRYFKCRSLALLYRPRVGTYDYGPGLLEHFAPVGRSG
jgi:hypothetical protein